MILPRRLLPKMTLPPLYALQVEKGFRLPVICLEHPLSLIHSSGSKSTP
ncbi:hypothetical protein Tco_0476805, partial [Tanacetum coccineum]